MRVFILMLAACSAPPPVTLPLTFAGLPFVQDGDGHWFVPDTGSPRTAITPESAGFAAGVESERTAPGWRAPFNPGDVPLLVTAAPPGTGAVPVSPYGGVIGSDLLGRRPFLLDPAAGRLTLGATPPPGAADVPVALLGAGRLCLASGLCASYGPSRLVLPVIVEGVATDAVLDSGNQYTQLTRSLASRLPLRADRPRLESGTEVPNQPALIRLAEVAAAGPQTRLGDVIAVLSDDEEVFAKLQVETGRRVEMVLGEAYLHHFAAYVDFAGPALALLRYSPVAPDLLPPGIGAVLKARSDGAVCLALVYPGLDVAAAGMVTGDCLTRVDDLPPPYSPAQLADYFVSRGIGARVRLSVDRGLLADVLVRDLLPPF